jgi:hypothetical protein
MDIVKFEEYRLFIQDTQRFQERRQTVTNIYIAINTILLSAVGLLMSREGPQNWIRFVGALVIPATGIAVCTFWQQLVYKYRMLIRLRFRELRRMEELPEMEGCARMYHVEDELYPVDEKGEAIQGQGLNISNLERRLPQLFTVLYVIAGAGMLVDLILTGP